MHKKSAPGWDALSNQNRLARGAARPSFSGDFTKGLFITRTLDFMAAKNWRSGLPPAILELYAFAVIIKRNCFASEFPIEASCWQLITQKASAIAGAGETVYSKSIRKYSIKA
ncbi:MAG TPA: hypothetical protein PKI81_02870 [bacterium]|nr:hypothetical protein [bacterium]HOC89902.1 hypothetical protein [bacterium]HOZ20681.1 hypothetical protein [bacterium]